MEAIILLIRSRTQRRKLILFLFVQILNAIGFGMRWKKINKFKKVLGVRRARGQRRNNPRTIPRDNPFSFPLAHVDIYERTGLFEDQFEALFDKVRDALLFQPKTGRQRQRLTVCRSALSPRSRLLLVLHWLRDYHKYRTLRDYYNISPTTIGREIAFLLPKLYCALDEISWPCQIESNTAFGSIDCTSHFRYRVHPRQADYYRADKHGFFITAQVVINFNAQLMNVHLGLGHNNDRGMFRLSRMDQFLEDKQIYLLADRGYSHHRLIVPDDDESQEWNNSQKAVRSKVEVVIGLVKHYSVCSLVFRHNPEWHELALMTCYQLQAIMLKEFPL